MTVDAAPSELRALVHRLNNVAQRLVGEVDCLTDRADRGGLVPRGEIAAALNDPIAELIDAIREFDHAAAPSSIDAHGGILR
jgi:hypothetical protein